MTEYERWLNQPLDDPDLTEELQSIQGQEEEINDRFYMDLEFGTAGLRGVIGAGTNRMNVYTVRKATQGLANYLLKHANGKPQSVAIAHDSRNKGVLFCQQSAAVLAANGYPDPSHTARQLEQEDIGGDVLLLTMEDRQKSQIWETFENAPHVFTLREYAGESGDVPALYGQPLAVYSQCYTELELLLRKVVVRLNEEEEL